MDTSSTPLLNSNSTHPSWIERGYEMGFLAASYLNEPACQVLSKIRQILVTDDIYVHASSTEKTIRNVWLAFSAVGYGLCSLVTTPLGILLCLALNNKSFIYYESNAPSKKLQETELKIFSQNICGIQAGYAITDGGVMPWEFRENAVIQHIKAQNADVICLYEVFDIQESRSLIRGLEGEYRYFLYHAGPNVIGASSGLFVASKVEIMEAAFVPFPQKTLFGRAKWCKKGFLQLQTEKIDIITTHLQHSENPGKGAISGEIKARYDEMLLICEAIQRNSKPTIVTGDLNLDETEYEGSIEYEESTWNSNFDRGTILSDGHTWGGDKRCRELCGKKEYSKACTLDYTLVSLGSALTLRTKYIDVGFDAEKFDPDAISDHKGLLSSITFC